jgi:hypothetical protein
MRTVYLHKIDEIQIKKSVLKNIINRTELQQNPGIKKFVCGAL